MVGGGEANITLVGKELDDAYLDMVKSLSVYPEVCEAQHNLKIVYPIHGTGHHDGASALKKYGLQNVHVVEEQSKPDGNFPTVVYPNPEERKP